MGPKPDGSERGHWAVNAVGRAAGTLLVALPVIAFLSAIAFLGVVVVLDEGSSDWLRQAAFGGFGTVYVVVVSGLPAALLGYGFWSLWTAGRVRETPQPTDIGPFQRVWSLLVLLVWTDEDDIDEFDRLRRRGLLSVSISAVMTGVLLTEHGML